MPRILLRVSKRSSPRSAEQTQPHGLPYCFDASCPICKKLEDAQEAIRLHELILVKKPAGSDRHTKRVPATISAGLDAVRWTEELLKKLTGVGLL